MSGGQILDGELDLVDSAEERRCELRHPAASVLATNTAAATGTGILHAETVRVERSKLVTLYIKAQVF